MQFRITADDQGSLGGKKTPRCRLRRRLRCHLRCPPQGVKSPET
jgi:hypothetical protein